MQMQLAKIAPGASAATVEPDKVPLEMQMATAQRRLSTSPARGRDRAPKQSRDDELNGEKITVCLPGRTSKQQMRPEQQSRGEGGAS